MAERRVSVQVLKDGQRVGTFALSPGTLQVGRSEDNQVCLPDIGVSRTHARLHLTEERLVFEDLGSGNGSWFEGRRIRTQTLVAGDEVYIDPFTLIFEIEEVDEMVLTDELTDASVDATVVVSPVSSEEISLPEPTGSPAARLEVVVGKEMPPAFDLMGSVTLGRSDQRDIVLAEPAASRLHAEIKLSDGNWLIEDAGSANGFAVNGQRVTTHILRHGDVIRIGATELRFVQLEGFSEATEHFAGSLVDEDQTLDELKVADLDPESTLSESLPADGGFGGVIAPDLGPAPESEFSFGGLEMDVHAQDAKGRPKKLKMRKAKGAGLFGNPVRGATVVIAVVVLLGVIVQSLKSGVTRPTSSPEVGRVVSRQVNVNTDPMVIARSVRLMEEGFELSSSGQYFQAFSKFHEVIKEDPSREDARRMEVIACEFANIEKMREDVQNRAASDVERAQAKVEAVEAATAALERGSTTTLRQARSLVSRALNLNGEDAELLELDNKLARRIGARVGAGIARERANTKEEMQAGLDQALQKLSRGAYYEAMDLFNSVLQLDPGGQRNSVIYYEAEAGLRRAQSELKAAARVPYRAGLEAQAAGNLTLARTKFREALRIYREYSVAQAKLEEVQGRLIQKAQTVYTQASTMQSANQYERAAILYQDVMSLVDDPGNRLYQRAKTRWESLGGM
jgi:pSer/pThr/pTyr-binding forkhead associated (FHA) protein/tetratricopeptide (TPR) repeat protein